jgi:hypothetical protein
VARARRRAAPVLRCRKGPQFERRPRCPRQRGRKPPARVLKLTELQVDNVVFVDDIVRFRAKHASKGLGGNR